MGTDGEPPLFWCLVDLSAAVPWGLWGSHGRPVAFWVSFYVICVFFVSFWVPVPFILEVVKIVLLCRRELDFPGFGSASFA